MAEDVELQNLVKITVKTLDPNSDPFQVSLGIVKWYGVIFILEKLEGKNYYSFDFVKVILNFFLIIQTNNALYKMPRSQLDPKLPPVPLATLPQYILC